MPRHPRRPTPVDPHARPAAARRAVARAVAALLATVALAASPAVAARRPAAGPAAARLTTLSGAYLEHRLAIRPQLASALGQHARDGELVPITEHELESERAWLASFERRLAAWTEATPATTLPPARRAEAELLRSLVARERFELDVRRSFVTDPNAYGPLVEGSIRSLLDRRAGPTCGRLRVVARRLRLVPEVLRAAQINLREPPPRAATLAALDMLDRTLALYRVELPQRGRLCRDAAATAVLAEADTLAVEAASAFRDWLRDDLLPRSTGSAGMGRAAFTRWLETVALEPTPLDSLTARAARERDAARDRVVALAARLSPGRDPRELLATLDPPVASDTARVAIVAAALDSAAAFVARHRLVTLPAGDAPEARVAPPGSDARRPVTLDPPGPVGGGLHASYLDVSPRAGAGRASLVLAALSEGIPGRHLMETSRRRQSPLRAAFPSDATTRGWSDAAVDAMLDGGFAASDDTLRLVAEVGRLRRLGRLSASLDVHTGGVSVEDAARALEQQCLLDPDAARAEAAAAALDPESALGVVAEWRLAELRERTRARLGAAFDAAAFHDAVLEQGPLPLAIGEPGILQRLGAAGTPDRAGSP